MMRNIQFKPYRDGRTLLPVNAITPLDAPYIHTYYDICPWSPSGRYLLCIRLPFEDREPTGKDPGTICVIDLQERTLEEIGMTSAWAYQIGAYQQWGISDQYVYFNDLEDGRVVTIEYDRFSARRRAIRGSMYHLSPDGTSILSPSLTLMNFIQKGYGVPVSPCCLTFPKIGPRDDEGLWVTDVKSEKRSLIVSFARLVEAVPQLKVSGDHWFFFLHSKYNSLGTRILQVGMYLTIEERPRWNRFIITCNPDGSDIKMALSPEQWAAGGHHPTWHPDGETITMNLAIDDSEMKFCRFRFDGADFHIIRPDLPGGGHPSISKDGAYLLTDAYVEEGISLKNDEVPIRLCGLSSSLERTIFSINTFSADNKNIVTDKKQQEHVPVAGGYTLDDIKNKQSDLDVFRLDTHPAWSRNDDQICFNAAPNGKRQVLIADLKDFLKEIKQV